MSFEHFCLRLVQTTSHIIWFAAPFLGLFLAIPVGDDYRRKGDTDTAVFSEVVGIIIFIISYGTIINGYIEGWNIK